MWIFLAHSVVLIFLLGFDFEFLNLAVFRPYPLVSYGMVAFWMGCGFCLVWGNFRKQLSQMSPVFGRIPVLAMLIPVFVFGKNLEANNRSRDQFAETNARMVFEELEPDAVLFVYGDSETGPLGYFHFAEGLRKDITCLACRDWFIRTASFHP